MLSLMRVRPCTLIIRENFGELWPLHKCSGGFSLHLRVERCRFDGRKERSRPDRSLFLIAWFAGAGENPKIEPRRVRICCLSTRSCGWPALNPAFADWHG